MSTKNKILLVEDEPGIVEMYSIVIKGAGFDLDVAVNREAAERLIAANDYKLVLLDIIIPSAPKQALHFDQREGFIILEKIRKNKRTQHWLVLTLTNLDSLEDRRRAKELKSEYIVKAEIVPQQLVEKIKKILNK